MTTPELSAFLEQNIESSATISVSPEPEVTILSVSAVPPQQSTILDQQSADPQLPLINELIHNLFQALPLHSLEATSSRTRTTYTAA